MLVINLTESLYNGSNLQGHAGFMPWHQQVNLPEQMLQRYHFRLVLQVIWMFPDQTSGPSNPILCL